MQVCNKDKLLKTENGFTLLAGFTAITHNSQLTNATVTNCKAYKQPNKQTKIKKYRSHKQKILKDHRQERVVDLILID